EEVILGDPVAPGQLASPPLQLDELGDRLLLARTAQPEGRSLTVALRIVAEAIEAGVAVTRSPGRLWIGAVEVREHRRHRRVHAVEVEPVEADGTLARQPLVVRAQPADEVER